MKNIIKLIKESMFYLASRFLPTKIFLKIIYKRIFGKRLDLKNPKTLTEKIQWRKIYDKKPIYTILSDKLTVREYIKEKIGKEYLIPLLYETDDPNQINFDEINYPFIIKANHGSAMTIIIRNKKDIDKKHILEICKEWLNTNFYYLGKEYQYKNIHPKILIERLLLDQNGGIPEDYKFHCFNGKVEFIVVDTDRFGNHKRSFFNTNWLLLPCRSGCKKKNIPAYKINKNIEKPKDLNKMIKLSEKLSKDFDYVRVDLYSVKNKIYFGELTFSSGSGFDPFFPSKYDKIFGKLWDIKK